MSIPKRCPDLCDVKVNYYGGFDVVFAWGNHPGMKRARVHLTDSMIEHTARQLVRAMKERRDALARDVSAIRDEAAS